MLCFLFNDPKADAIVDGLKRPHHTDTFTLALCLVAFDHRGLSLPSHLTAETPIFQVSSRKDKNRKTENMTGDRSAALIIV